MSIGYTPTICPYCSYPYFRLQVLPSEQGGVSHRSSRPQQVRPAGMRLADCNVKEETESILFIPDEPQALH